MEQRVGGLMRAVSQSGSLRAMMTVARRHLLRQDNYFYQFAVNGVQPSASAVSFAMVFMLRTVAAAPFSGSFSLDRPIPSG